MNILFIFSRHSKKKDDSTLTKDLANEFLRNGHNVTVVTMLEKKENLEFINLEQWKLEKVNMEVLLLGMTQE